MIKLICSNFSFVYVMSEATRNSLSGCKFQNYPGGACPQTSLVCVRYCTLEFPPSMKKSCINPWHWLVTGHYYNIIYTLAIIQEVWLSICMLARSCCHVSLVINNSLDFTTQLGIQHPWMSLEHTHILPTVHDFYHKVKHAQSKHNIDEDLTYSTPWCSPNTGSDWLQVWSTM